MRVISCLLFLLLAIEASSFDSPQKQKTIRQLRDKVSIFLSEEQMTELMDIEGDKIRAGKSPDEIATGFKNDLIGVLESSQYQDIVTKGLASSFGLGNITIFDVLDTLGNVLYNNLLAFVTQLCNVYSTFKQKGLTDEACDARGFAKVNQFVTDKRMNTIFCRFRSHFTDKQWSTIYKNFKGMFLLSKYPCCIPPSSG